jgi:hypothetical protein
MSDDDEGGGMMGKLIKYGIILLITGIFPPFLLFYLGWKYVKLCVKFYFKALYLIIRLPIWLFIQLPLHYLGVGMHVVSNAFSKAYGVIMVKKKRYALLFGLIFLLMLRVFLPDNTDAVMSFLTEATLILPFLVLIPFIITFGVALISSHFRMPDIARKEMPGGLDTGMKSGAATGAAAAAAAGQMGMKAYNNREELEAAKETAQAGAESIGKVASEAAEGEGLAAAGGETILAGDMVATLESMPLLGSMVAGGGEAAGMAAGAASTATAASGGSVGVAIFAALILAILGFFVISAILTVILWGTLMWLTSFLAPLISPILGAIGLGQAYGSYFGSEVANTFLPQIDLTAEMRMVEQAGAKVGCALQGPACLRQWRLNNTARPGSKDVGEKYRLEIQKFSIGGQGGVDIAYKRPDYRLPVSFLLLNTRHGLKGIDARKVKYRVRVIDADRTGKRAYCSTRNEDGGEWIDVESTIGSTEGSILPGTSFSPRLTDLDSLTLKECEMLQPALGQDYTGELDVKYKYSSQSTLYVRAMSRRNMRDEGITPSFKKSETADTPVETFINVKEPITYVEAQNTGSSEGARTVPFTVKVGTNTDRYDVEYRVHPEEFKVYDSSRTQMSNGSCIGLDDEGRNTFVLSGQAESRMDHRIDPDDTTTWFDKAKNPAAARCTFNLSRPGSISPTGETLTMRVDANYTVVIEQTSDPFEVRNTMCSRIDCPVLFRMHGEELDSLLVDHEMPPDKWDDEDGDGIETLTEEYKNYKNASCDGVDAGNGCTAVDHYRYDEMYAKTTSIEDGELAVEWNKSTALAGADAELYMFSCSLKDKAEGDEVFEEPAVGVPKDEIEEVKGDPNIVFRYAGGEIVTKEYTREISYEAFSDIPDWIAEAEYSETKEAKGCRETEEEGLVPEYEVNCRNIDVGGISGGLVGSALYLATSGGSCGGGGG